MTIKGGTNKACAACKFQRRKCSKDCLLSPYFPADKPKTFSNAHRLFGVCNMVRILKQVEPDEKDEAMKSIIFESDMRARYPVHGCYGVMVYYQNLLARTMEEQRYVRMLLAYFKQQSQQQHHPLPLGPMDQCSMMPATSEVFPLHNHGEFSLFNGNLGNVAYDSGSYIENYIESKDDSMNKSCCSSVITHVGVNQKDEKPNSMSGHEQLDNPFAGANDAKPSKFRSWAVQGQPYHHEEHFYHDDSGINKSFCSNTSAIAYVSDNSIYANPNLRSMHGLSHQKDLHIPHASTKVNANAMDAKSSKLKSVAVQGQSYCNDHDIFYYDVAPFEEFDNDRQSFIECKDACESWYRFFFAHSSWCLFGSNFGTLSSLLFSSMVLNYGSQLQLVIAVGGIPNNVLLFVCNCKLWSLEFIFILSMSVICSVESPVQGAAQRIRFYKNESILQIGCF